MIVQGAVKPAPGLDFASEPDVRLGSSLSSNRSLDASPFLMPRLWFAGSSVVFAVV